ncbi:NocE [Streptomyces sp. NPDC093225]|uniref:golvesin C-terminal-like domain-containing protein n=1 Tax=Streptomyces sp. NPDC093225 TaxID=3366034 RepID=UPI0037F6ECF5
MTSSLALPAGTAGAAPVPRTDARPATAGAGAEQHPAAVPPAARKSVVGKASDRAWTTSGDAAGFHVLVADATAGYRWKTAATLSEPGFDTDAWIGNACVTESGRRAVVAYAPRTFTNKPELMTRGAFTAVVDLATGKVSKLPVRASLSFFSPGCGEGEQAVLSQFTDDASRRNATRLVTVDASAGRATTPRQLPGQVTSAIPYGGGEVVAAAGRDLVRIGKDGVRRRIATAEQTPFEITKDAAGGITFLDRPARQRKGVKPVGQVKHVDATAVRAAGTRTGKAAGNAAADATGTARVVATGEFTGLDVAGSASGEVYVTGAARTAGRLPAHVHNPGGLAKGALLSTRGQAAVTSRWAHGPGNTPVDPSQAVTERTVVTGVKVLGTGRAVQLEATPGSEPVAPARVADGGAPSPALTPVKATPVRSAAPKGAAGVQAADPNNPVEAERTCAVPRGDLRKQAFQPTPRQVEWAADQAVINALNPLVYRAPNWKGTGMAGYNPQSLFPLRVLSGDPNGYVDKADNWHIPAAIMLGVTAQESNMWQASRTVVPGATGNPLIGNYYGIEYAPNGSQGDPWAINWSKADCGYGITQITDGMRLPGHDQPTMSTTQQEAAALDYVANIAAGADKLAEKWNQTRDAGLVFDNGQPKYVESWYFALWSYNTGFHPQSEAPANGGQWGLGWTNNPADPLWKANRMPFLESPTGTDDYSHASHPQDWPYQEKVLGWAARPPAALFKPGVMAAGYKGAWWNAVAYRTGGIKTPEGAFCTADNQCDWTKIGPNDKNEPGLGACNRADLYCWWHQSKVVDDCDKGHCGVAIHRFDTTYPEQPDENSYPPRCPNITSQGVGGTGLPSNALIVDDVPNGVRPAGSDARGCGAVASAGTFTFDFTLWNGTYPSKIDMHQIGAGYGNHFWFSHTRDTAGTNGARMLTTGTWTLGQNIPGSGWARVLVHMPDHGAHTRQARYVVHGTDSTSPVRVTPQRTQENRWVDLGSFHFTGTPKVSLSTHADGGNGNEDVAWDAVAFQPLPGKPKHQIVAMGDSFSSGEGASVSGGSDYYRETNFMDPADKSTRDACHRSKKAWSRQATLPGMSSSIGTMADAYDTSMDFHLIACSGARTYQVLGAADGGGRQGYGEVAQLDAGYLDQNTNLVTISIGGNDTRFTDVFIECLAFAIECYNSRIKEVDAMGNQLPNDTAMLGDYLPDRMKNVVRPAIVKVLKSIQAKAPNARIILMGYPPLLENGAYCIPGIQPNEAMWLNTVGDDLLKEMGNAVNDARNFGVNAWFSNPKDEFAGKAICGNPESVHGIVMDVVESDDQAISDGSLNGRIGNSAQSFHPKIAGARLYADSLEQTLRDDLRY